MTEYDRLAAHSDDVEAACARLCVDFANHIDARRYAALLDLFAEDGRLDRMGTVSVGRAEISRFLEGRSAAVATRHVCTNIRIDVQSTDEATGFCYALFFQGSGGGSGEPAKMSGPPSLVEYRDLYERTPQGWRIKERRIVMAMRP